MRHINAMQMNPESRMMKRGWPGSLRALGWAAVLCSTLTLAEDSVKPSGPGDKGNAQDLGPYRLPYAITNEPTAAGPAATPDPAPPKTPRESYNAGARQLRAGKLNEAEGYLEKCLASQDTRLQPPALYNLGEVRFGQGMAELKKGPQAQRATARGRISEEATDEAVRTADDALAGEDVQKLVAAYLHGKGVRKDLKAATAAVQKALETHAAALAKWRRSADDFQGTTELDQNNADAQKNLKIVNRYIAALVDQLEQMKQCNNGMCSGGRKLAEKMKQLKGRIPASNMPPGAPGDDEDDEDPQMGKKPNEKEGPSRDGEEMVMSVEQAGWLLEGFKLDNERRLPMGQGPMAPPKDRNRPTW
jgi:hypothetical protein